MTIFVSGLNIYPLKSGAARSLKTMQLTHSGPVGDRDWVLVQDETGDEPGKFISQRTPSARNLALIEYSRSREGHIFRPKDSNRHIFIPDQTISTDMSNVDVWGKACSGHDAGNEAAEWFSEYIGMRCRLMKRPANMLRQADQVYAKKYDYLGYADGHQVLVTSHSSLRALGDFEDATVNISRFRGNIEIDGAEAFQEDVMHIVRIGDAELEMIKPCTRCPIPNIDQNTGELKNKEVISRLGQLRKGASENLKGVFFGENASIRKQGKIEVGMSVEIIATKPLNEAVAQARLNALTPTLEV